MRIRISFVENKYLTRKWINFWICYMRENLLMMVILEKGKR